MERKGVLIREVSSFQRLSTAIIVLAFSCAGLSANSVSNKTNLIFWYDVKEAAIFYCNVTRKLDDRDFECRQKYLSWSPGNRKNALLAMMSFDVSRYNAIDSKQSIWNNC